MISVVVVNYNRSKLLKRCLESLTRQTLDRFEAVVVDNGSEDDSRDVVRRMASRDPRFRLLVLERNLGFAAGCNRGFAATSHPLVALLNNDAEAEANWLAELSDAAERYPEAGMFACKIRFAGSKVIDKAGHLIFPDGQNRGRGTGERDGGQYDREESTLFPDGCAALYRRRLLQETGGFCEEFFAYGDDADLGLRARWLGWECVYVPSAVVHHRHSATTGRFHHRKVYWVERNRLWVAVRNLPGPLLLLNPFLTAYRWCWNGLALLAGKGSAGEFRGKVSTAHLVITPLRALFDGMRGAGPHVRARRSILSHRQVSMLEMLRLLWRFRISARDLAFKERVTDDGWRMTDVE